MNLIHVSTKGQQVYTTPAYFVALCARRFGVHLILDLAADEANKRAVDFFSEKDNSLIQDWTAAQERCDLKPYNTLIFGETQPACWLNPPFNQATAFMRKCAEEGEKGCKIITLTLSSMGTQWYKSWVKPYAMSYILEDRITFEGQPAPYPKELMISLFGFGMTGLGWWNWKAILEKDPKWLAR